MKITRPARVIAWDAMTPRQQAQHLVYIHGFDVSYFSWSDESPFSGMDNSGIVDAFLTERFTDENAEGNSYPHPEGRDGWHAGDHDEDPLSGGRPHTHDKEA